MLDVTLLLSAGFCIRQVIFIPRKFILEVGDHLFSSEALQ